MRGQSNNLQFSIRIERQHTLRGLQTIHLRHLTVHQDEIKVLVSHMAQSLIARRCNNYSTAEDLKHPCDTAV